MGSEVGQCRAYNQCRFPETISDLGTATRSWWSEHRPYSALRLVLGSVTCVWSAFCIISSPDQHMVTLCSSYLIPEAFIKYYIRTETTIQKTKQLSKPYSVLNLFTLGPFSLKTLFRWTIPLVGIFVTMPLICGRYSSWQTLASVLQFLNHTDGRQGSLSRGSAHQKVATHTGQHKHRIN
jgi:hypothetical protein